MGSVIQDSIESAVSISEAFSMLRMHCNAADVRATGDAVIRIIDNFLSQPLDKKFARVDIENEVYVLK